MSVLVIPPPVFPLGVSTNGRYIVDANGFPYHMHGEAFWDSPYNLSQADFRAYLDDRKSRGHQAMFGYLLNSVAYAVGSVAPKLTSNGALPFLKNLSGGTWDGDPNFTNHDADISTPNEAYFAEFASKIDDMAARGMTAIINPLYNGFSSGNTDGWQLTMGQSGNTQAVHQSYGNYLATGHGTFTGFASRGNIIWSTGGDTLPGNGSALALKDRAIIQGLQQNGCTQLIISHWSRNTLPNDQSDLKSFLNAYGMYVGTKPYAMARNIYGTASPTRPVFLIEDYYWGDNSQDRTLIRYNQWGAALTTGMGGAIMSFTPFWIFVTSADGSTAGSITGVTNWVSGHAYNANQHVSANSNWYRAIAAGTSGSTRPSGTANSVSDGGVDWAWVAAVSGNMGGIANLLATPAHLDHQVMRSILSKLPWWRMVPSGLASMRTLVTSGGGTAASYSDGSDATGGADFIVAAQSDDGNAVIAYVPDPHSGSFQMDLSGLNGSKATAQWVDPVSGVVTPIGLVPRSTGVSFSVPSGGNAASNNDWVLVIQENAGALRATARPRV